MSFSSTPKTAFFYFSRWFSNWGGEFLSKSLGAILSPRTDGFVTEGVCVWGGELGRLRTTTADLCFNYSNGHSFTEGARRPAEYWSHPETLHLKSQGVHSELTGGSRAPARQGRGLRGAGVPRVDPGELWAQERERGPRARVCQPWATTTLSQKLYGRENAADNMWKQKRRGEKEGTINSRGVRKLSQRGNIITGWAEFCKAIQLMFGVIATGETRFPLLPSLNLVTSPPEWAFCFPYYKGKESEIQKSSLVCPRFMRTVVSGGARVGTHVSGSRGSIFKPLF